ncbi:hypothetical protein M501DRAFT_1019738 [Patellaria atrata CBS 101060]|uniref:4Fe-4S ferredoxin-type domain-containing protein n=1 Tax=Patellaria atrata CBS 101060 TaxID=1346257 RepID=A0A9P4VJX4_9PEZI|nr:hypothetical protein M501DRAFT_1019738 [Patellaria atrata CBS 101060]
MEGKIEEDAQAIGSLPAQLRYVYMHLQKAAKINMTTFYELEVKKDSPNPYRLLERLNILYGERNRRQKAIQSLHSIRQRDNETFIAFYPRFEREIANADAEGKKKDTYEEFAQRCEKISNDMELFGQWAKVRSSRSAQTTNTETSHRDMEWEPTPSVPTSTQVNSTRTRNNKDGYPSKRPEDQVLIGKRAKWVDQGEINARIRENHCLRCGRDGCRVSTCPLAAPIRPKQSTHVSTAVSPRPTITQAMVEEDDSTEEDASQ